MNKESNSPGNKGMTAGNLRQIIGDNVRCFREKMKWSQKKLGNEAGLHNDYIGKVERGNAAISVDNLHKLAVLFRVNTAWLLIKDYCFSLQKFFKKNGDGLAKNTE